MRKTWVIAVREYLAAVRTKAFIVVLLIMPLLMGGSALLQILFKNVRDTEDKHFAVIDRSGGKLYEKLQNAAKENNDKAIDPSTGKQTQPKFILEEARPDTDDEKALAQLRLALSDRVRQGELMGFLEIGPEILTKVPELPAPKLTEPEFAADDGNTLLRYYTNRPTFQDFVLFSMRVLAPEVQKQRTATLKLNIKSGDFDNLLKAMQPVPIAQKGLSTYNAKTDTIEEATEQSKFAPVMVPLVLMMLMFMVVMMSATPLMQGVLEEKMLRISEVLLGSVTPFKLMMGKLIGGVGVSLTMAAVYLCGGYWAAHRFGFAEYLAPSLIGWFLVFQVLSALMFGSLCIAVGAACTDMKEAQTMLLPIMLVACIPMFLLGSLLREPNGPVVSSMSFFPFATPMLMVAREAVPPGIPLWHLLVGIVLVLATTLLCVWAAGRIFRVGILMQGKGAKFSEIIRWVFRG